MKTVNKLIWIVLFTGIFSCKKNNNYENKNIISQNYIIDYDRDSIFYRIDVKGDEKKELFLITKNIIVNDSNFGIYNIENWKKAYKYNRELDSDNHKNPNFNYNLFFNDNNKFTLISEMFFYGDGLTYPILKPGIFNNLHVVSNKNLIINETQYLKIMEISDTNLNSRSINLVYQDNKWKVFSKEVLNNDSLTEEKQRGYCLDTVKNSFSVDKINFDILFDSYNSNFTCKCLNN